MNRCPQCRVDIPRGQQACMVYVVDLPNVRVGVTHCMSCALIDTVEVEDDPRA